jgi:ankyrin repeat protein
MVTVLAARKGHLEVVKILLDNGAFIDRPDKLKRSALIHAVKNGHLPVASYLISRGADFTTCDSSKNSGDFEIQISTKLPLKFIQVLHYAAAYGWSEIVSYLAKLGADTNAFNDWKVTPLAAAMMKGHIGCADILLECKGIVLFTVFIFSFIIVTPSMCCDLSTYFTVMFSFIVAHQLVDLSTYFTANEIHH